MHYLVLSDKFVIIFHCVYVQDYKFVEIRVSDLRAGVRLAVISRFKREVMSVSKKTLRVCSSADPRVSFTFNPTTLTTKKSANFMVEVRTVCVQVFYK